MLNPKSRLRKKLFMKYFLSNATDAFLKYNNDKQSIVVALAADYGNLGDVAITKAQTEYLESMFPKANVIDFPISQTFTMMKSLKKVIKKGDIITLVGGGNTGDMYDDIEYCRQFVISQFPDNLVVAFPQTIDFSNTAYGEKALTRFIKVYNNHSNLFVSAREKKSFDKFKMLLPNVDVLFVPDIVLSLKTDLPNVSREGISLVLRDDSEKQMKSEAINNLKETLKKKYNVSSFDNTINTSRMGIEVRKEELNKQLMKFKRSGVVVTDRLHGMIFAVITNTPCIAIDNSNKKISGVYNAWLNNIQNLKVLETFDKDTILEYVEVFSKATLEDCSNVFSYDRFTDLYKQLVSDNNE